jgi:hypothetical protein
MIRSGKQTIGLILGLLLVIVILAGLQPASAQEQGNGLRITPLRQEFTLSPGQNESFTIEVTNVTSEDTTVGVVVNDFVSDNETGQPRLLTQPQDDNPFSLRNFVDLPGNFDLAAGESQTITIGVRIPEDAAPGGYFGAVRFNAGAGIESGDSTVALSASVANLLLVNVPGEAVENLSLDYIRAQRDGGSGGSFFETAPNEMAVRFSNDGNTIIQPFGKVIIRDIFGNEVFQYEINNEQIRGNVLPQSSRTFTDSIEGLGFIGRYDVEANLGYGEGGGNIITATTSFWVIPWKVLLAAVVVLAGLIWAGTKGIKIYNRRVVEKAKRNS